MIQSIFGTKIAQGQAFLEDGSRIPVTTVKVGDLPVVQVKTKEIDGYAAIQVGIGLANEKKVHKAVSTHVKKANITTLPKKLQEIRLHADEALPTAGEMLVVLDVLKPGDTVDVTGFSKGKGFAGGVKRHNFRGGPRTHGQSDRERAPGSLGQTTTPGRVYKGKRMAGHMGQENVTIQNLLIIAVKNDEVIVKGLLPGSLNSLVTITKTGESKNFIPLMKDSSEDKVVAETVEETVEVVEEAPVVKEEEKVPAETEKTVEEVKEDGK